MNLAPCSVCLSNIHLLGYSLYNEARECNGLRNYWISDLYSKRSFPKRKKKVFFWCATIVHTLFVGLSLYIRTHTRTHIQVGMLFLVCTLLCYFYILIWVMKSNNYEGKCFWNWKGIIVISFKVVWKVISNTFSARFQEDT